MRTIRRRNLPESVTDRNNTYLFYSELNDFPDKKIEDCIIVEVTSKKTGVVKIYLFVKNAI